MGDAARILELQCGHADELHVDSLLGLRGTKVPAPCEGVESEKFPPHAELDGLSDGARSGHQGDRTWQVARQYCSAR